MRNEVQISNFKVEDGAKPVYVQDYVHQSSIELYAAPVSKSNLIIALRDAGWLESSRSQRKHLGVILLLLAHRELLACVHNNTLIVHEYNTTHIQMESAYFPLPITTKEVERGHNTEPKPPYTTTRL